MTSRGIIGGPAPSVPITAVWRSCVSVPMTAPVLIILVEEAAEASVIITCARESGICTVPNPNMGWPQARMRSPITVVTLQPELMERSPSIKSIPTMSPG